MIYGPDDKPIVPEFAKALKGVTESWYKKSVLKMLESKMRFTDWWGPRLYDAMGSQIEWPNRPRIPVRWGSRYGSIGRSKMSGRGARIPHR
jgi:hypothetical protein